MPSPAATPRPSCRWPRNNHIPIDFGCQEGELRHLPGQGLVGRRQARPDGRPAQRPRSCRPAQELGKITKAQIEQMYVDDIPPTEWRLACQMIVRDEDILVEYPSK